MDGTTPNDLELAIGRCFGYFQFNLPLSRRSDSAAERLHEMPSWRWEFSPGH